MHTLLITTNPYPVSILFQKLLNVSTCHGLQLTSRSHQNTTASSQPTGAVTALKSTSQNAEWHIQCCWERIWNYATATRRLIICICALQWDNFDLLTVYLAKRLNGLACTVCVPLSQFTSERNNHYLWVQRPTRIFAGTAGSHYSFGVNHTQFANSTPL